MLEYLADDEEDVDEDGFHLISDCDDVSSFMNPLDIDGDGLSTCDGDCHDGIFEIKYVMFDQPFFMLGKGYIFELQCEKFEQGHELFACTSQVHAHTRLWRSAQQKMD